jgi:hypothetical protein
MSRQLSFPIQAARVLHADLCAQRRLVPIAPPTGLSLEPGEWVLGVFTQALTYHRYCAAEVVYPTGPALVVGSPHFLVGYALGRLVQRARLRRKARRLFQPQWRSAPLVCTVVTNRRLWCQVDHRWTYFDYGAIAEYELHGQALTLSFTPAVPLRITGAWAPWIAVAVAHLRYGSATAARIPALNTL